MGAGKKNYDLYTEAGEGLKSREDVWQQYPRPQMKREQWQCLNGFWNLDGKKIRVPFAPESLLAEYQGEIREEMTYTKKFDLKSYDPAKRTLLHFQAVDQVAEVYLNDIYLGMHEGGYLPFSFDITDAVKKEANQLVVKATDRLDKNYPYGKQCKKHSGMWYTPTSGIWQSVWLEQVPGQYISGIKIVPDTRGIAVTVEEKEAGQVPITLQISLHNGEQYTTTWESNTGYLDLSAILLENGEKYEPQLWSPKAPYLYTMTVETKTDRIETYFALRAIDIREIAGINRVCLNGTPIFLHGVLDQGYFSDGIMTPAEESEYEKDILRMKELGFNLLRKHIKIEPECFYYYCDKLGMLVMQDMVNNGEYSFFKDTALPTIGVLKATHIEKRRTLRQKLLFEAHMLETLKVLQNHPCIIAYTIFNEGWGQFESDRMYGLAKKTDPTRLYDATSGWFAEEKSDFDSLHIYFGKKKPKKVLRPVFLSEFGGYSYKTEGHIYSNKNYGYGTCKSREELFQRIEARYEELVIPYIKDGLCGSIYTQLSDIEEEINGFYTYDRKVCKVERESMRKLSERVFKEINKKN